jgi:uncharacterized glyoxalase superfamily protein PhnB
MAPGPSLIPGLFYEDPDAAVAWLAKAFGFELRTAMAPAPRWRCASLPRPAAARA